MKALDEYKIHAHVIQDYGNALYEKEAPPRTATTPQPNAALQTACSHRPDERNGGFFDAGALMHETNDV